jgi:glycosyltransferase involved in cell wall biosynthesis
VDSAGIMQMVDTLDAGGMERVAINIANLLPRDRYDSYLCTTRRDGVLEGSVATDVGRLRLNRSWRFDLIAMHHLVKFIRAKNVRIIHAHDTSVFAAAIASRFRPYPIVVWHDHWGLYPVKERPIRLFRLVKDYISGVIAVNESLARWSEQKLGVPADRIWYVPNGVCQPMIAGKCPDLPGKAGYRIVCVANLRAQKDHLTLLRAMSLVVEQVPAAHLLLVGPPTEQSYFNAIHREIAVRNLDAHVSMLGQRLDVPDILSGCDIGVLSSAAEGLPLALIEYGMAELPVVATRVGQCAEVLDEGSAGILIPPSTPHELAEALVFLLKSPAERQRLGKNLHQRVQELHQATSAVTKICAVYDFLLSKQTN